MADPVRDTEKPNTISADKSGFGAKQAPPDAPAPDSDSPPQDPHTTALHGPPPNSEDHNSAWVPNPGRPID
jgi:hypothetical protein